MKSLAYIPASNQATNASQMTVQSVRSPGASDIIVNTVTGAPAKFYGSMGAPHTFTDPVTSEIITIISEATAVDFAGHLDSGKVVIDVIAPGYVDTRGSLVGDIVVIRPVTEWANNIFNVLSESHNDDGTLKESSITYEPTIKDFVQSGGIWSLVSGLNGTMTALTGYITGRKNTVAAIASRAFTASKDTYVDILRNTTTGVFTVVYTEVANGAAAPALAANSMRIGILQTNGSTITGFLQRANINGGWSGFDSLAYPVYPSTPNSRLVGRVVFTTNGSTGASSSQVPWNGINGSFPFRGEAGKSYRVTIHEGIIDGYAGTSGFIQLVPYLNSAPGYITANQVGYVRDALGSGGVGFDRTFEFTTSMTGIQYICMGFVSNGASGTLAMERGGGFPATYTVEEVIA